MCVQGCFVVLQTAVILAVESWTASIGTLICASHPLLGCFKLCTAMHAYVCIHKHCSFDRTP